MYVNSFVQQQRSGPHNGTICIQTILRPDYLVRMGPARCAEYAAAQASAEVLKWWAAHGPPAGEAPEATLTRWARENESRDPFASVQPIDEAGYAAAEAARVEAAAAVAVAP